MKTTLLMLFVLFSTFCYSQVQVRNYVRSNGTYVQSHQRTYPDHLLTNNYSYPGNHNPNTGKITGSSEATISRIDTYSSSGSIDWKAVGSYQPTDFNLGQTYSVPKTSTKPTHVPKTNNPPAKINITIPKHVPVDKRNYMKNNKGEVYGYSYILKSSTLYSTYFVYDMDGKIIMFVNKYPNGKMYAYSSLGDFITIVE